MSQLYHYSTPEQVADLMFPKFQFENWVVVKDESKVIKFPVIGGDYMAKHRSVVKCLVEM